MAVLTDSERAAIVAAYGRELSEARTPFNLSRPDLRAAINALDDFLNTNVAAINNAIPLPARTVLTPSQKARLLTLVIERRWIMGA